MLRHPSRIALALLAGLLIVHGFTSRAAAADSGKADTSQIDVIVQDASEVKWSVPDGLTMRVRMLSIEPAEPTPLQWKHGGWGAPGSRIYGHFWKPGEEPLDSGVKNKKNKKNKQKPSTFKIGEWSAPVPLAEFAKGGAATPRFLQVFGGNGGEIQGTTPGGDRNYVGASTNFKVEFEFLYHDKLIKHFTVEGPDGPIVCIVIPYGELTGDTKPTDPAFLNNLITLKEFAKRRADWLESQPWSNEPKPKRFAMATAFGGYAPSYRIKTRYADKAIVAEETRTLRLGDQRFPGRAGLSGGAGDAS